MTVLQLAIKFRMNYSLAFVFCTVVNVLGLNLRWLVEVVVVVVVDMAFSLVRLVFLPAVGRTAQ